ncbi:SGNH/GDSL hydrolase family protein [Candidatus Dependentiae bacterium]|nr:SGNH/GDSL hydrolase family protein [Candidatus Dependentiae bacterium]
MSNLPIYKKIIFVGIFFCFLFIAAEIAGRFINFNFNKDVSQFSVPMLADRNFVIEDEELFWKFKPSVTIHSRWTFPSFIKINSDGFRSNTEYIEQKSPGTTRIACIGNSVTFGYRRSLEESFEYILQTKLNSNSKSKKFEIYNFGVPGYTSHQGLAVLKKNVLKYNPDIITVCFGINDERLVAVPDKFRKVNINFFSKLEPYFQKLFTYKVLMKLYYDSIEQKLKKNFLKPRVSLEDYEKNLDEIISICSKKNINVIIITPPYNPALKDDEDFIKSMKKYRESAIKTAIKNNCRLADYSKKVDDTFKLENINYIWDSCHPDIKGNTILADMLETIITQISF